jgi:hypothetical protein
MAYGIWDKRNHEFGRSYELWYDEEAVAKLLALDEETWLAGGPEVEAIEDAAEEKAGFKLFRYETKAEAEEDLNAFHPYYYDDYEIRELPADEPEWILLNS